MPRRFIPWQLEPDPGIRQRRRVEAERELLRIAGAITADTEMPLPRSPACSNDRRQRCTRVSTERRSGCDRRR